MPQATPVPEPRIAEQLHALRSAYLAGLPDKLAEMERDWGRIASGEADPDVTDRLYRVAHQLAGSGATFGFPEISRAARTIVDALEFIAARGSTGDDATRTGVEQAISALHALCEQRPPLPPAPHHEGLAAPASARDDGQQNRIYLVDDDPEFCERVALCLREAGYEVEYFHFLPPFEAALAQSPPSVVLMDMALTEGPLSGAHFVTRQQDGGGVCPPYVFLTMRGDLQARLAAVRAGASGYLTKPVDVPALLHTLDRLTGHRQEAPHRILMVDDDADLTGLYGAQFRAAGIEFEALNTPADTLSTLQRSPPDLILMDVAMPGINGLEMGAIIRQFDEYQHIPIVFLTSSSGMETRLASMRLGGDDFLGKPVDAAFLIEVVRARISRARALKAGEQATRQAMRELQHFRMAQDRHSIISIADAQGVILDVNTRFCELSGYSRAELIGQNHRIIKSGHHPPAFYDTLWSTISAGKAWHGQIMNRKKDGSFYWVDATITPIMDAFGVPERFISVRTDITQLKALEANLKTEKDRLNLALDATNTGFWEWNLPNNHCYYSPRWLAMLGYGATRTISWPMLIHPEDYPGVISRLLMHLDGATPIYASEHRKLNAHGNWDWVYECGRVVGWDEHGEVSRIIGTLQQINERKAMEAMQSRMSQQLLQAAKMEAIGHLTSGIAHDFNNILGGMLGFSELARAVLERESPDRDTLRRYLGEVANAGQRAKELVAQMLVFGRAAPEQEAAAAPAIALSPIFKEVLQLLKSATPSSIQVHAHLPDGDLRAAIQPVHLHQILLNLGVNARDATGEYGQIDFSLSRATLPHGHCTSCNHGFSGNHVELSVRDRGTGIPEAVLKSIFDPFFTTKEVGKGTGMGLSVVHGLVHAAGGHIIVDSHPGQGTTMRILLPEASPAPLPAATHSPTGPAARHALSGLRIMVVDDERIMASMMQELLSMQGAHVEAYTRSVEALQAFLARPEQFDLVITDETMPEMSGMDLSVRLLARLPELPIILCTGYSDYATAETARQHGIAAFMHKPVDMDRLFGQIRRLIPTAGEPDGQPPVSQPPLT